jgi:hypothetical protein
LQFLERKNATWCEVRIGPLSFTWLIQNDNEHYSVSSEAHEESREAFNRHFICRQLTLSLRSMPIPVAWEQLDKTEGSGCSLLHPPVAITTNHHKDRNGDRGNRSLQAHIGELLAVRVRIPDFCTTDSASFGLILKGLRHEHNHCCTYGCD